jgi:hypothetical protein
LEERKDMDKKGEFISKAVEIAAGVIVGYVTYIVSAPASDLAGLFGIVIGLLTTLVVSQLVESYRHAQDIGKIGSDLALLMAKIGEKHQDTSDLAQVLRYGVTTIPRDKMPEALIQLTWKIENKMLATAYVHPDEGWGRAYGQLYGEIQRSKIKVSKAHIRRVFIVDSKEEIEKLRSIMYEQKKAGIKVRYILKSKIENTPMIKTSADRLETLDFDVVDSKYVWLTFLDKNRKIQFAKVVFGKDECDRYTKFYDLLFEETEEFV